MRKSFIGAVIEQFQAAAPVPYVRRSGVPGWNDRRMEGDQVAQMSAMGSVGTLFAIVNKTSTSVAAVGWHMHQVAPGKMCEMCDCEGVRHVERHPALAVWNRPNDFYTRQEFVESQQQHVDLTGESWWVVDRIGNRPIELWPVRPDKMEPVRSREEFIAGYVYTGPDGEKVPLERTDVVQIRMPSPLDPWRGMGPVQTLMANLYGLKASAEYNANFFENSAVPGGVVEFSEGLSDNEWLKFIERWRETHRGVSNAHRVATIEKGKWTPAAYSMKDMMFTEGRILSRDEILEAFGMSKFAIGRVDDVNRASAEAAKAWFAESMTVPRLDRFRGALNNDFLPMFGDAFSGRAGYSFVYSNPVPEDREADNAERESKASAFKTLVDAGVAPEDAAIAAGLPPMRMRELVSNGSGLGQAA